MAKKTEITEETPALVTVRVTGQPVFEGEHHAKGSTFETTPERAAALGDMVEIVTAD
jgi:hypothetical protein